MNPLFLRGSDYTLCSQRKEDICQLDGSMARCPEGGNSLGGVLSSGGIVEVMYATVPNHRSPTYLLTYLAASVASELPAQ